MKNCTGILCPMQFGTVDPATCQAVDYCPQATPPKTNADRIRSMTDEELAKKISGIESFALTCGGGWPPEKWLDWLKKEYEGWQGTT